MRPYLIFIVFLIVFLIAAGCFNPKSQNEESEEAVASEPTAVSEHEESEEPLKAVSSADSSTQKVEAAPAARPRTADGLVEQPRMEELRQKTDPEFGEPESTEWRESEYDVPDSMTGSTDPGELLVALSAELRFSAALGAGEIWEKTFRVHRSDDDEARGIIMRWGLKDDAMIGADLLVEMSENDGQWYIDELQDRYHCLRGVTDGLCL